MHGQHLGRHPGCACCTDSSYLSIISGVLYGFSPSPHISSRAPSPAPPFRTAPCRPSPHTDDMLIYMMAGAHDNVERTGVAAPGPPQRLCGSVGGRIDAVDIEPDLTHTTWRPLYRELKYTGTRHQSACQSVVQRGMILLHCTACYMYFVLQHTHMWAHRNDSI